MRRLEGRLRARLWHVLRWADVGPGAHIGRRCRRSVEVGGHLVIGSRTAIDDGVTLAVAGGATLKLGAGAFVGHHTTLAARDRVAIGDRTFIAELVSIRDHDHDPDQPPADGDQLIDPVVVGADVWSASKVIVARGVNVGNRAVLAGGAVVRDDVAPGEIVGGVPARHLRWVIGWEPTGWESRGG